MEAVTIAEALQYLRMDSDPNGDVASDLAAASALVDSYIAGSVLVDPANGVPREVYSRAVLGTLNELYTSRGAPSGIYLTTDGTPTRLAKDVRSPAIAILSGYVVNL